MKCLLRSCPNEEAIDGLCQEHYAEYRGRHPRPKCPLCGKTLIGLFALEAGRCFSGCEDRAETGRACVRARKKRPSRSRRKAEVVVKVEANA